MKISCPYQLSVRHHPDRGWILRIWVTGPQEMEFILPSSVQVLSAIVRNDELSRYCLPPRFTAPIPISARTKRSRRSTRTVHPDVSIHLYRNRLMKFEIFHNTMLLFVEQFRMFHERVEVTTKSSNCGPGKLSRFHAKITLIAPEPHCSM